MYIYYKSDFRIEERFNASNSSVPFKFTYRTTACNGYVASFDGENYVNCSVVDEQTLLVTFDQHALDMGQLRVEREYFNSDSDFNDGVANRVVAENLDIVLSSSLFDCAVVETVVLPPYAKGDDGYTPVKGVDYFTEDEIDDIKDDVESRVAVSMDGLATESYVDNKIANILSKVVDGDSSIELADNTIYVFTNIIDELTITLPSEWNDSSLAHVKFKSGDVTTTLSMSDDVIVSGVVDANSYVEVSIMGNIAFISSVAYE